MQKTSKLTDEEVDALGYQALKEKLGVVGATRFIGLQLERAGENYAETREKMFEGMNAQDIYDEAVRLEAERGKGSDAAGR